MILHRHPAVVRLTSLAQSLTALTERHWKWLTFLIWIVIAAGYLWTKWPAIEWLVLSDTDDNVRYVQVKDWLGGQGWYDLTQHRFDPPRGGNIHWSRIVDIPIAGLIILFRTFVSAGMADRLALGIAPLLPLLPLMLTLGFIVRRLAGDGVRQWLWLFAALSPFAAQMSLSMYMPMRVDHHGWQLTLTIMMLAGLIDRNTVRGGVVAGLSSALSIAIGMEMMVYLAAGGAFIATRWVFQAGAERRMLAYALSLGAGVSILFVLFASYANRQMVCDAISPIWVAIFAAASAGMVGLSLVRLHMWWARLLLGALVGAGVGAFAWFNWPQCLTGAYQISPELQKLWLANIREAKPITVQDWSLIIPLMAVPAIGAFGLLWGMWVNRRDKDTLWAWAIIGLMMLFSTALLFWQLRAGPAAQLMALPPLLWAAHRLIYTIAMGQRRSRLIAAFALACMGLAAGAYPLYTQAKTLWGEVTGNKPRPWRPAAVERSSAIKKANARCRTLPSLEVLNQLPPATIFTMVDLGPRIIATTHHSVLGGPYHRNGSTILDAHHAFDGKADDFRAIAARHGATYLLICPNFPEGTVYSSRSPKGFYAGLMRGQVPAWLHPVELKTLLKLPYTLYKIDYSAPNGKEVAQQR